MFKTCHKFGGKWLENQIFRLGGACGDQRRGVLLRLVLNIASIAKASHCREAGDRRQKMCRKAQFLILPLWTRSTTASFSQFTQLLNTYWLYLRAFFAHSRALTKKKLRSQRPQTMYEIRSSNVRVTGHRRRELNEMVQ